MYIYILTLFPYTTLFRSACNKGEVVVGTPLPPAVAGPRADIAVIHGLGIICGRYGILILGDRLLHSGAHQPKVRSEEHTSELQSRENIVCRLLLEKKKKQ